MAKLKQLPHIPGFSTRDDGVLGPLRVSAEHEDAMATVLAQVRFQRGKALSKVYANLTVLFRLLLYYADFKDHALFWFWIRVDWGLPRCGDASYGDARAIADYYVQARIRGCFGEEQRRSLLARLVDAWRQEALKVPRSSGNVIELLGPDINVRRTHWQGLRDNHVDVLMDSKQPACLLGVVLPERTVTSLWEPAQDPLIAELMGSPHKVSTDSRVISDIETQGVAARPNIRSQPTNNRPKRCNQPASKRRKTMGDTPEKTKHNERQSGGRTSGGGNGTPNKRSQQWPSATVPPQQQNVESSMHHCIDSFQPANDGLKGQLGNISLLLRDQQREVSERIRLETTGYVPASAGRPPSAHSRKSNEVEERDREMYESRIAKLEDRLASLEKRLTQETDWARSIGTFLYDANEKTLGTFREVFGAISTLKDVSGALVEGNAQQNA